MIFSISFTIPINAVDDFPMRSGNDSKINSVLLQWISSNNPEEFADKHDLKVKDDKIFVYIYLVNNESLSKIPKEIEIISSHENTKTISAPN